MNHSVLTSLPVFNEELHIESVLNEVRRYSSELLVVDDGSTDGTPEILARQTDVHVIRHERNLGYGAALNSAFQFAISQEYDVLVTIDCDGQHEPKLIPELVSSMFSFTAGEEGQEEAVDIVSGSRYLSRFPDDNSPPADRRRINRAVTAILNGRFGMRLTDAFCGFKAYRVDSLKNFTITEFGYAMPLQLWIQAVALGMRIVEFPVPLVYLEEERSFGGSLDDADRRMAYYTEVIKRETVARSLPCAAE